MTVKELKAELDKMDDNQHIAIEMLDWEGNELTSPLREVTLLVGRIVVLK